MRRAATLKPPPSSTWSARRVRSTPARGSLWFGVAPRWSPWLAVLLVGCSHSDDAARDAGSDATAEVPPDAPEMDVAADADSTLADVAADVAYDAAFAPPAWSPVCVPAPPADAGADAGADDAATDAPTDVAADAVDGATCTATRVRIVAANLTSGASSTYETAGIHILEGLHPDIVLMQEFKYPGGLRALVDAAFDPSFRYVTEIDLGAIPNGIVSRYPIIESGEWDDPDLTDRDWVWARIDVPGPIDLFAVSTHLRTTSAAARDTEAKNLVAYVKSNVPAGAYLVIGGDFNTALVTEPALVDLKDVVDVSPPYAVDQAGVSNTNAPRSKPYDWVLPSHALRLRMIPVSIGTASFPAGLVFDTRVFLPLSDVAPAASTDSAATNMQHMAIVRDFALGG